MSGTSQRRGGVFALNVNGQDYDIVDGVTYSVNKFKREGMVGISGPQGFKETYVNGYIKAKIRDGQDVSVTAFTNMTNASVIGHAANGKTVSGTGMFITEVIEVDPIEGVFEVNFEGPSVIEITNA